MLKSVKAVFCYFVWERLSACTHTHTHTHTHNLHSYAHHTQATHTHIHMHIHIQTHTQTHTHTTDQQQPLVPSQRWVTHETPGRGRGPPSCQTCCTCWKHQWPLHPGTLIHRIKKWRETTLYCLVCWCGGHADSWQNGGGPQTGLLRNSMNLASYVQQAPDNRHLNCQRLLTRVKRKIQMACTKVGDCTHGY